MAHILVIEDNPRDSQTIRFMLEFAQHTSEIIVDGQEAYESLSSQSLPDAVVVNFLLPGLDGCFLCRKIRQTPALAHLPIFMLAPAFVDKEAEDLAQRAGASTLFYKPLQRDHFLAELDRIMMLAPYQSKPLAVASAYEESTYLRDYSTWLSQTLHRTSNRLESTHDQLEVAQAHVNAVHVVTTSLGSSLDLHEIAITLVRRTGEMARAQAVAIYDRVEPDCFRLRYVAGFGIPTPGMIEEYLMGKTSPLRDLTRLDQGLVFNNPDDLDLLRNLLEIQIELASAIASPLISQGELSGFLVVMRIESGHYNADDAEMLFALSGAAGLAVRNAHLFYDLEQAYAELQDLDRRKSEFVAIASHELRTPIAIMLGYASLLREDETDPTRKSQLGMIERQANFMAGMVDILINFYELQQTSYTMQLHCVPVHLDSLLQEALDMAMRRSNFTRAVTVSLDAGMTQVIGDEVRLLLAFQSLLDNAMKFSQDGGQVRVVVAPKPGGGVVITVEDQGIGIPENQLEHIFEPFYQIESSLIRRYGGLGLGLALVKGIVDIHGGTIDIKSRPDKGTRVIVTLPARPPEARCID